MTHTPPAAPTIAHPAIDEPSIGLLIRTFYGRAREDEVIGPIFAAAVIDWDDHIAKIADFWSSVMLRTARYNGRPLRPHLMLPLEGMHFDRWLELFEATAREPLSRRCRGCLYCPCAPDRRRLRNGDRHAAR